MELNFISAFSSVLNIWFKNKSQIRQSKYASEVQRLKVNAEDPVKMVK